MTTKHYDYYSYQELSKKALSANAKQVDIDTLGAWFESYGSAYWTGECYKIDAAHLLFPVYSEPNEDGDFEIVGYEIR